MSGKQMTPADLEKILAEVLKAAKTDGGRIDREKVRTFFDQYAFTEEQLDFVCDFLLARGIIVEGYEKKEQPAPAAEEEGPAWSEAEQRWLDTYREDLSGIPAEKEGEWEQLAAGVKKQDPQAKRRMAELFLPAVVEEAIRMYRPGVHLSDVIQEGSLNLVLCIDALQAADLSDRKRAEEQIRKEIRAGIRALLAEHEETKARDHKLVQKAEDFRDGVTTLKEEYGRKVYLDEVADFLNITEDEAEDILRLTGDSVSDDDSSDSAGQDQSGE